MRTHKTSTSARMVTIFLMGLFCTAITAVSVHLHVSTGERAEAIRLLIAGLADAGVRQMARMNASGDLGDDPDAYRAGFEQWSRDCLLFPQVRSTLLLNKNGQVVQQMPSGEVPVPVDGRFATMGTFEVHLPSAPGQPAGAAWVIGRMMAGDAGEPAAGIAIIGQPVRLTSAWGRGGWIVAGATFAVALLTLWLGIIWARRSVGLPVERLIECLKSPQPGTAGSLATRLSDDLGRLALAIDAAVSDGMDARERLQHLDRTFDSRVAHQTREYEHEIRRANHKSYVDPLTGLGNRRMLDDQADQIVRQHLDGRRELSVAMFDVDNFKTHNDSLGHAAGDSLLRFLGELLRGSLRHSDVGIRYAGDEFVVLMPDTLPGQAGAMAERIVRLFAQKTRTELGPEQPTPPTLSVGVTSLQTCGADDAAELIRSADAALYRAKNAGKNNAYISAG